LSVIYDLPSFLSSRPGMAARNQLENHRSNQSRLPLVYHWFSTRFDSVCHESE
jgi:hypothetical protein